MNLLQQHRKQYVHDNFNEIVAGAATAAAAAQRCDENKINIQSIYGRSSLYPKKLSQSCISAKWRFICGASFISLLSST